MKKRTHSGRIAAAVITGLALLFAAGTIVSADTAAGPVVRKFAQAEPETEEEPKLSFSTTDFAGKETDSAELFRENTYTMVNLWTSWCIYCIREMPELEEMSKEFAEKDCGIIGIMMDGNEEEALAEGKRIAEEAGVTYPLLIPTEDMMRQLFVTAYPTTFFVDADGVLVGEPIRGMAPELYRETLEELLAEAGAP